MTGDQRFFFIDVNIAAQQLSSVEVMVALCEDVTNPPSEQEFPYHLQTDEWFENYARNIMRTTPYIAFESAILAISPSTYTSSDEYRSK